MRDHYFDFNTLKQDLIEHIENMDPNDPESSVALVDMYNVLTDYSGGINLHHNDVKDLIERYKTNEEALQEEFEEERPDAAYITSYKREMDEVKMKLLNIAKIKVQEDSVFGNSNPVTPEELVTYWLTYGI